MSARHLYLAIGYFRYRFPANPWCGGISPSLGLDGAPLRGYPPSGETCDDFENKVALSPPLRKCLCPGRLAFANALDGNAGPQSAQANHRSPPGPPDDGSKPHERNCFGRRLHLNSMPDTSISTRNFRRGIFTHQAVSTLAPTFSHTSTQSAEILRFSAPLSALQMTASLRSCTSRLKALTRKADTSATDHESGIWAST